MNKNQKAVSVTVILIVVALIAWFIGYAQGLDHEEDYGEGMLQGAYWAHCLDDYIDEHGRTRQTVCDGHSYCSNVTDDPEAVSAYFMPYYCHNVSYYERPSLQIE